MWLIVIEIVWASVEIEFNLLPTIVSVSVVVSASNILYNTAMLANALIAVHLRSL